MIVFAFFFMYWIVALILAMIFTKCNVTSWIGDSVASAVFWPLTFFYYIVIYPFIYIDEKLPRKSR